MSNINKAPGCKKFTGYKPCYPDHNCYGNGCKENNPAPIKILIINLDAMGDVIMTTARLESLKMKFPDSAIYWVTMKISAPLLQNNPYLDKVFIYDFETISILGQIEFDYVMNADKSQKACALTNIINAKNKLGFGLDSNGKIAPMNDGALYNYNLGMDDHLKFRVNQKTKQEYLAETFELPLTRDEYVLNLEPGEIEYIEKYKTEKGISPEDKIIGFNTGCSNLYPNKKMTIEQHIYLIDKLLSKGRYKIILLGGPEDKERNDNIYSRFPGKIINTPTNDGIRRGACYASIPDVVVTGDSFGMHLSIGLKKYIIAWFGLSCWTEIDLYDRGVKLFPQDLFCSPCWKKSCPYNLECVKGIDLDRIIAECEKYFVN
ncbi:MAG: glycosyltransferase family 9 protein [Ignavibacteriales bacterium]|nr:glycosyltransferase family 9 protein [Ignavibacteriales bacterium]